MGGVPNRTSYELHLPAEMSAWYSVVEFQGTLGGRLPKLRVPCTRAPYSRSPCGPGSSSPRYGYLPARRSNTAATTTRTLKTVTKNGISALAHSPCPLGA